jgi:hypothetical protein
VTFRFARALALTWLIFATTPASAAAPDANARRLYLAGQRAYDAGRFDVAIAAFQAAYDIAPADLLVFDLAQAFRKKFLATGERAALDKAIELYRRFLASPATGRERSMAVDALGELLLLAAKSTEAPHAPSEGPRPPKTEIMIVAEAPEAQVSLDDKPASPAPLLEQVAPGEHRAHVTAPGHLPADVRVTAVEGRFVVSEARLQPLPGSIEVAGAHGAQLEFDGHSVGALPLQAIELGTGRHQLSLRMRGYVPWERDIDVGVDQHLKLRAELSQTLQRRSVLWVAVAAAVVGAAAIAGAITWGVSDSEAAALYERKVHGQLLAAEVPDYDHERATRDQARIATSVCIGIGATLSLVSIGLYVFERR